MADTKVVDVNASVVADASTGETLPQADMSLLSITEGENARGIPFVKFIDDVEAFTASFSPPASSELIIGAYSELHAKFKTFETSLIQKSTSVALCRWKNEEFYP
jgi:hypothetical protein